MAAPPGRAEPGRTYDVEPQVTLLAKRGLARVQAHPHADRGVLGPRVLGVRALRLDGRRDGVASAGEGEEERVALRVDLGPVVAGERLAHEPPVIREHAAVAVAELLEQPRGAFDVAEDEGHRARREPAHVHTGIVRLSMSLG